MKKLWHKLWYAPSYRWSKNDENGSSFSYPVERKRFKWVGPITGWKNDELMRMLTGRFHWSWGLHILNHGFMYHTWSHVLKWWLKQKICVLFFKGHDYGGPVGSCSRCGDC